MSDDRSDHVTLNRRHWDERAAAWHGPLARDHWLRPEPCWGLWQTPESRVKVFPDDVAGADVIEIGCGTGYVSAWSARAGARPTGVDISREQLATTRSMQREFGIGYPLVLADAEHLPFQDACFDLAVSEFGASLWCDPYRWIPEAVRVLRPGGRLTFVTRSPLFALCARADGQAEAVLRRPQFGLRSSGDGTSVEFQLPHGEMIRLLRSCGCVVEDLIEIQAPQPAHREYAEVSADWASRWPSEEIWKARRSR
ncbi:class I SAM-dependent methyltransferase [Catenulispora subtropica]|uniref:Methyltransferase type 11 domain-containing protein n=1 Tax=Catenulispora subtropica TaxID=450798 RepID=A0ABP5CSD0_9ACTN